MMSSWWLLWLVFMFFLFASPVTYGWGVPRMGPAIPEIRPTTPQPTPGRPWRSRPVQTRILGVGWRRRLDRPPLGGHGALLVAALVSLMRPEAARYHFREHEEKQR
jgi:hypothetical protein